MSTPLLGHGEHGHDKTIQFTIWLVALFLILWFGNTWLYHLEKSDEARKREAAAAVAAQKDVEGHPAAAPVEHKSSAPEALAHAYHFSLTDALYRSLQLFHFHDTHWGEHPEWYGFVARYSAGAFTMGLPLVLLGWLWRGGVRRAWHWMLWHDFVVIVGDSSETRRLARDLVKNGRKVVLVDPSKKGEHLHGGVLIAGDLSSARFWRRMVKAQEASAIVLMSTEDAENLQWRLTLERSLHPHDGAAKARRSIPCHLHLGDLHLKRGLVSLLPAQKVTDALDVRYFSRYEVNARLLARRYPLPLTLVEKEQLPEHYVIIGFGQMGQNVALKLVNLTQQVVHRAGPHGPTFAVCHPRVTIVDRRGRRAVAGFLRSRPGFEKTCTLQVLELDCEDKEFLDLDFLKSLDPQERCALIFCLENEPLMVSTILAMLDTCAQSRNDINGIYLRARHRDGAAELLCRRQAAINKGIPIVAFGSDKEIWTEDVVLNLSLDTLAEEIHNAYRGEVRQNRDPRKNPPAANREWLDLGSEDRESNREAADHLWAKLRTLGYELEVPPFGKYSPDANAPQIIKDLEAAIAAHLQELASSEHYRWMAWRLNNGWTKGDRDDAARKHPDLVEYHELKRKDKQKDHAIVKSIKTLVEKGLVTVKKIDKNALPGAVNCADPEAH